MSEPKVLTKDERERTLEYRWPCIMRTDILRYEATVADLERQLQKACFWSRAWKLLARLWYHMGLEAHEGSLPNFRLTRDFVAHYYEETGEPELAHQLCPAYGTGEVHEWPES